MRSALLPWFVLLLLCESLAANQAPTGKYVCGSDDPDLGAYYIFQTNGDFIEHLAPGLKARGRFQVQDNRIELRYDTANRTHSFRIASDGTFRIEPGAAPCKRVWSTPGERLEYAARTGNLEDLRGALKDGADPLAYDESAGLTPLYLAALGGAVAVVEILLSAGGDVHQQNPANRTKTTPLHGAAMMGHVPVARRLVAAGADVNARDISNFTPLLHAAFQGQVAMVKFLLEQGARTDIRVSVNDQTALDIARERGHTEIVRLLESAEKQ